MTYLPQKFKYYRSFCKHDSDALEHTMIERVDRLHRYIPLLTVK